jgi:hypothetical protein
LVDALLGDLDALRNEKIIKVNANGYIAGIGIAVVDNESGQPTGQVVILADKFAIVTPGNDPDEAPKVPFIVGQVGNQSTVGINGQLVVNGTILGQAIVAGTITADLLTVGQLSAISADMGDLTAGTMRTGTAGDRVEISDTGTFRIWAGSGLKTAANAKFYFDENGNAVFAGTLAAVNGVFTGTLDGVDGIFTGTVYAENIIGDVIDRLAYNELTVAVHTVHWFDRDGGKNQYFSVEYAKKLAINPALNVYFDIATVVVLAASFPRYLSLNNIGFLLIANTMDARMTLDYNWRITVNGITAYESPTVSITGGQNNVMISPTRWMVEGALRNIPIEILEDQNVTVKAQIIFTASPWTSGLAYNGAFLARTPGLKLMDAYKKASEGISYS